jgi:hypothetical protein
MLECPVDYLDGIMSSEYEVNFSVKLVGGGKPESLARILDSLSIIARKVIEDAESASFTVEEVNVIVKLVRVRDEDWGEEEERYL